MERFNQLNPKLTRFIEAQHVFFVGTAARDGSINVSPKGLDTLRVLGPNRVVWMNLTGSGNETSAHVQENGRMTLMFCSFERQPLILRLYGSATVIHPADLGWREFSGLFPEMLGTRQFFDMSVSLVQTSCGYAVPFLEFSGERETLDNWSRKKGPEGIERYWSDMNTTSLDGKPVKI
ncbi:MAG: pyridoxamine 5'-phosphate oxidase family protein [Pseudomonadota bacterium]